MNLFPNTYYVFICGLVLYLSTACGCSYSIIISDAYTTYGRQRWVLVYRGLKITKTPLRVPDNVYTKFHDDRLSRGDITNKITHFRIFIIEYG